MSGKFHCSHFAHMLCSQIGRVGYNNVFITEADNQSSLHCACLTRLVAEVHAVMEDINILRPFWMCSILSIVFFLSQRRRYYW